VCTRAYAASGLARIDRSRDTCRVMPKQADDLQTAIEALPALYAAFSRRDFEAALARFDPEGEYIIPGDFPEGETYRGHAGARRFWELALRELDYWRVEPERFIPVPPDTVLVFATERIRGRASKVETSRTRPTFAPFAMA
jgi:ketosteroid isomerase-like protein